MTTGLERLRSVFADARQNNTGVLMPFIVGGHPAPGSTGELLHALARGGAGVVEVGFPFSDPIADGPVVAAAMHDALQAGATPRGVIEEVRAARDGLDISIVAMVSASIVQRLGGPDAFVKEATGAGFDGFIFPDVTLEESGPYVAACKQHSAGCSLLVAPSSDQARAAAIASVSTGFVYLLARAGVTGERSDTPDIAGRVAALRATTNVPIAAGFGISTPEHVAGVIASADAAIVGSALVRRLSDHADHAPAEAERFTAELAGSLQRA